MYGLVVGDLVGYGVGLHISSATSTQFESHEPNSPPVPWDPSSFPLPIPISNPQQPSSENANELSHIIL